MLLAERREVKAMQGKLAKLQQSRALQQQQQSGGGGGGGG